MKLGAKKAFFPVIAYDAADRLGQALLDRKHHPLAIIVELWVDARIVGGWRREARGTRAGRLRICAAARRIHDDGLVSDGRDAVNGEPGGRRKGLRRLRRGRGRGVKVVQGRERRRRLARSRRGVLLRQRREPIRLLLLLLVVVVLLLLLLVLRLVLLLNLLVWVRNLRVLHLKTRLMVLG